MSLTDQNDTIHIHMPDRNYNALKDVVNIERNLELSKKNTDYEKINKKYRNKIICLRTL